jgi:hypothetical protein
LENNNFKMLSKDVSEHFELTDPSVSAVVQHPTLGRIAFAALTVDFADWLVQYGYEGLKRKEKAKTGLPPMVSPPPVAPVLPIITPLKPV